MGRINNGGPLPVQLADSFQDLIPALGIYRHSRLVHKDQLRLVGNAAGNVQSAQKASGKLSRTHFPKLVKAGKCNGFFHQLFSLFPVWNIQAAEIINVLIDRHLAEHCNVLHDDSNALFDVIAVRLHLFSENFNAPFVIF